MPILCQFAKFRNISVAGGRQSVTGPRYTAENERIFYRQLDSQLLPRERGRQEETFQSSAAATA